MSSFLLLLLLLGLHCGWRLVAASPGPPSACGPHGFSVPRGLLPAQRVALVACRILVPRPEIEPASPALEGGFLTTDHQGSP